MLQVYQNIASTITQNMFYRFLHLVVCRLIFLAGAFSCFCPANVCEEGSELTAWCCGPSLIASYSLLFICSSKTYFSGTFVPCGKHVLVYWNWETCSYSAPIAVNSKMLLLYGISYKNMLVMQPREISYPVECPEALKITERHPDLGYNFCVLTLLVVCVKEKYSMIGMGSPNSVTPEYCCSSM